MTCSSSTYGRHAKMAQALKPNMNVFSCSKARRMIRTEKKLIVHLSISTLRMHVML
jgi:hypothetical protein